MNKRQSVVLAPGLNLIHGLTQGRGQLWATTATDPAKLILFFNYECTLAAYTAYPFPADGRHNRSMDIIYCPATDRLYTVFEGLNFTLTEIDPDTLEMRDILLLDDLAHAQSLCAIDRTLYIALYGNTEAIILKVNLDTMESTRHVLTGYKGAHAIRTDGVNIFVTGASSPAWVARINPVTMEWQGQRFSEMYNDNVATDDFAFQGDYLWVGLEQPHGFVIRVKKDDLSLTRVYSGVPNSRSYCMHYDGKYVWNAIPTNPGVLGRIDPLTLQPATAINLEPGEDQPNEILSGDDQLFVACFISPARMIKMRLNPSV